MRLTVGRIVSVLTYVYHINLLKKKTAHYILQRRLIDLSSHYYHLCHSLLNISITDSVKADKHMINVLNKINSINK